MNIDRSLTLFVRSKLIAIVQKRRYVKTYDYYQTFYQLASLTKTTRLDSSERAKEGEKPTNKERYQIPYGGCLLHNLENNSLCPVCFRPLVLAAEFASLCSSLLKENTIEADPTLVVVVH